MRTLAFTLALAAACCGPLPAGTYERELGGTAYTLEEVFYDSFDRDLSAWRPEGDAVVRIEEGWLEVDATTGRVGAATVWCAREFSGPQVVEYDVRLMGNTVQSNINMFLLASLPGPTGLLGTSGSRTGAYGEYHAFPNYLITLLNDTSPEKRQMLRLRMRLDPGFELADERWYEPLDFGRVYHVAFLVQPPLVTVFLDGRPLVRTLFRETLERGLHGLRVWHTRSLYDNFRVSRVIE